MNGRHFLMVTDTLLKKKFVLMI